LCAQAALAHQAESHASPPRYRAVASTAWCRIDVWPTTHHVIAGPDPTTLLAAVLMREPAAFGSSLARMPLCTQIIFAIFSAQIEMGQ
jgi:hypothetical protein